MLWVQALTKSFGRARPAVSETAFRELHARKDYNGMVALVKKNLCLGMRLRIGYVNSGGPAHAPCWIGIPENMPSYGTQDFRNCMLTMHIRKSFLAEAPYGAIVVAIAHELSHVVLDATQHPLRKIEPAVDLTAMLLGYRDFFLQDSFYVATNNRRMAPGAQNDTLASLLSYFEARLEGVDIGAIGYLTHEQRCYAAQLMCQ
jgi:hypothetical protein